MIKNLFNKVFGQKIFPAATTSSQSDIQASSYKPKTKANTKKIDTSKAKHTNSNVHKIDRNLLVLCSIDIN